MLGSKPDSVDDVTRLLRAYNTIMDPKLAEKQDQVAVQSYISQKLAPFDDYQFTAKDKEAVAKYIGEHFK